MAKEPEIEKPPTAREKKELETLVRGIVRTQGNVFIKNLLREQNISIGVTKDEFEATLLEAVEKGDLRRHHIDEWLQEVEGWGNQHVLLYRAPLALVRNSFWTSPNRAQQKAEKAGLGKLWNADTSLSFPDARTLSGIHLSDGSFRVTWHQGLTDWTRDKSRDYQETIEDDLYEFRAFRQTADRSVMRFELRLSDALAAVFLQEPWSNDTHANALKEVGETVSNFFDFSQLTPFKVSSAIRNIDQAALEKQEAGAQNVRSHSARLSSSGAYVEFASKTGSVTYQDIEEIRQVRRAVRPEKFQGEHGSFLFRRSGARGAVRELRIDLYGGLPRNQRIRVWAQMTATEVWEILRSLKKHG